jgi:hypothetical protein
MGKDVSDYDIFHPLSGTVREGKQMSDVVALNSTDAALSVLMVGFTSTGSSCTLTLIGELNGTSFGREIGDRRSPTPKLHSCSTSCARAWRRRWRASVLLETEYDLVS